MADINNHQKLVRAAIIAIQAMQDTCQSYSDHAGARIDKLLPALEVLTDALYGQKVRDEQVVIKGKVISKTAFVEVTIHE